MKKGFVVFISIIGLVIALEIASLVFLVVTDEEYTEDPEEIFKLYFMYLKNGQYEEMCKLVELPEGYTEEDFIARNRNIYEGIDADEFEVKIQNVEKKGKKIEIEYVNSMNTSCGYISFMNKMTFNINKDKECKIEWASNLIFPELNNNYKVRVSTIPAMRGNLLDRHGAQLTAQRKLFVVGIVPGKLGENRNENIARIGQLVDMSVEAIEDKLSVSWAGEDTFVPICKISYERTDTKNDLLQIPGVMIDSELTRVYPYGEVASHITGYAQNISAEELEQLKNDGYNENSMIGKVGLEKVFEERLRGIDGKRIYIENDQGGIEKILAELPVQNGETIQLTIDIDLQQRIYEQWKYDEGFFVVINSKTGEILALVSTPSYDANIFMQSMTNEEWNALVNAPGDPLYTRFLGSWCPGSTMKPLTGAIGLTSGTLKTTDTFYYYGRSWRKNASWKDNYITTLTSYSGKKNLRNALMYSDNIYFAQATLKIGGDTFMQGLDKLKFNQNIDMGFVTSKSQYANAGVIDSEVMLANSGYGQGEILVNPIHMASIYSAFVNDGNMIQPYIEYDPNRDAEYLVQGAFSPEAANEIKEGLFQAVENPYGTGHDVKIPGIRIAGKTGTAELKETKDTTGDILGWFDCFIMDDSVENSLLIISMAKNRQSPYLKAKIKTIIQETYIWPE